MARSIGSGMAVVFSVAPRLDAAGCESITLIGTIRFVHPPFDMAPKSRLDPF